MNQINFIQIIATAFLFFAISRVWLGFKNRTISAYSLIFWLTIWTAALTTILRPEITTTVAQYIGIGRGADVVIYSSIIVLYYLIFRTQVMLEDLRHEITRLTQAIALNKIRLFNEPASSPAKSKTNTSK